MTMDISTPKWLCANHVPPVLPEYTCVVSETHVQFQNMYENRAVEENYTVHTAVPALGF